MGETLKVYKGTDKDMKCRGMQYELGKTYESEDAIRCGSKGFHSCEAPLDVFNYYHPRTGARYFSAEAEGTVDRTGADDSKVASSKLTLKTEIGIPGIVKAQIEYVKSKTTMEYTDPNQATAGDSGAATAGEAGAATAGNWGAATAGNKGAATAGNWGAATAGDSGAATTGDNGIAVCNGGKVRGGLGAVLVIAERDDDGKYIDAKVAHVDGETIKADTWYRLKDGQFVEVE
jgi:hypothetical protein